MEQTVIEIPEEFERLLDDDWREAAVWGGRSSLKSHTVARYLLIKARMAKTRILCAREFQNSIAESSHQLLADLIDLYKLTDFKVTDKTIVNSQTGSEFIFKGLHHNEQSIKSIEGVNIAWVEEAQTITQSSIEILTPTIREKGSQIIWTYNRLLEEDPVHRRLVIEGRPNSLLINVNYDIAIKYGWMAKVIFDEMEDDRDNRPALYKQKWLGEPSSQEGRIYSNWLEIDAVPHEAVLERYGMDFGYTCLGGGTMVATENGSKRIDTVNVGDFVLTTKGFRRVNQSINNGYREVYSLDFGLQKPIIVTGDHRIFTTNGWKEVCELNEKETICVLKQNLMGEYIEDTQMGNTQTISIGKEKQKESLKPESYIGTSTQNLWERYQRSTLFTTLMKTLLIIISKILSLYQTAITQKYIKHYKKSQRREWMKSGQDMDLLEIIGSQGGKKVLQQRVKGLRHVVSAVLKSTQQIRTRSSVAHCAERKLTQENQQKNILVKTAEQVLYHPHTTKETHALQSVQVSLQRLKDKELVYDLSIDGEHEFFADSVLVHNCDPTAIVAVYRHNGGLILDEITYTKGLSNKQIADILLAQPQKALTIADCAEPKSIDDIAGYGISIVACQKGADSIRQGIQLVQDQRISYTRRSNNIRKEYNNYLWRTDRNGQTLSPNVPESGYDHAGDALRYAITDLVKNKVSDFDYDAFEANELKNSDLMYK
jgi:phage terminase large subunit